MSEPISRHQAVIDWKRDGDDFSYKAYTRDHAWRFEGGVTFAAPPDADQLAAMHHEAHEQCFIANSVRTAIEVR